jgi:isovaleryl-CoA dehydrogenase
MPIDLTDEQLAFSTALADFCKRETGTRRQRGALGPGGHHPGLYDKMAALGWLGVEGMVDTCLLLEASSSRP